MGNEEVLVTLWGHTFYPSMASLSPSLHNSGKAELMIEGDTTPDGMVSITIAQIDEPYDTASWKFLRAKIKSWTEARLRREENNAN